MMKIAVEGMMKAQAAGNQVNNEQLGELTRLMAQREKRELEQKDSDHVIETNGLKDEMNRLRAEMEGTLIKEIKTLYIVFSDRELSI